MLVSLLVARAKSNYQILLEGGRRFIIFALTHSNFKVENAALLLEIDRYVGQHSGWFEVSHWLGNHADTRVVIRDVLG